MKTTKTTKTNVAPAAPMTAEEKAADNLAVIERDIDRMTRTARQTLARNATRMAEVMATIATNLEGQTPNDDSGAAYNMTQSYWPLRAAAEAAGELKVLATITTKIAELKEKGLAADALLPKLLTFVTATALQDTSRSESSSNPYSNAMSADAGNGRGKVYQNVAMMIQCFIDAND